MRNIPESEAISFLATPLLCEDCGDWSPIKVQPGSFRLGSGVLDQHGVSAQMYVELLYHHGHRTNITTYKFTLFKRHAFGNDRVYQLEIMQSKMPIKDVHKRSHEHMGATRSIGCAKWASWGYDDVLAHFCAATNLTFNPTPVHPEHFQLTADR